MRPGIASIAAATTVIGIARLPRIAHQANVLRRRVRRRKNGESRHREHCANARRTAPRVQQRPARQRPSRIAPSAASPEASSYRRSAPGGTAHPHAARSQYKGRCHGGRCVWLPAKGAGQREAVLGRGAGALAEGALQAQVQGLPQVEAAAQAPGASVPVRQLDTSVGGQRSAPAKRVQAVAQFPGQSSGRGGSAAGGEALQVPPRPELVRPARRVAIGGAQGSAPRHAPARPGPSAASRPLPTPGSRGPHAPATPGRSPPGSDPTPARRSAARRPAPGRLPSPRRRRRSAPPPPATASTLAPRRAPRRRSLRPPAATGSRQPPPPAERQSLPRSSAAESRPTSPPARSRRSAPPTAVPRALRTPPSASRYQPPRSCLRSAPSCPARSRAPPRPPTCWFSVTRR